MTTAYTSLLGLALPVTGELSGTWGDTVNNSITSLLDSAIAGTTTLSADTTLTTTTGASNQARQAILLCTGHVANITITAPAQSKIYTVINASATYTVKIRGAGPTTGITIPVSSTATVAWNGSDFVDATNYINGNITLGSGTPNGVAYLNGSKVLTTGSALTFDGTLLRSSTYLGLSANTTPDTSTGDAIFYKSSAGANLSGYQVVIETGSAGSRTTKVTVSNTGAGTATADWTFYGVTVGRGAGAVSTNTAVGASALAANSGAYNSAFGYQALQANTSGNYNQAFGNSALLVNTSGSSNSAMGQGALGANTTGSFNSAFGYYALVSNTTASSNTAVGYQAGYANTTGANSVFLGNQAGTATTTASFITAVGNRAAYSNTTGTDNTAVGAVALNTNTTGGYNIAVGNYALYSNTTASNNTAVGYQAVYSNTTGTPITAFGYQAAYAGTTADWSTAFGYQALKNTTGTQNSAFGRALVTNTSGASNSAFGMNSLYYNTTGSYNTAYGQESLFNNTTASNNTAVGYQAGYSNTTGAGNTLIGYGAGYGITTGTSNTCIGPTSGTGQAGIYLTTGSKNTIIGGYTGNQGGLDIRTANNYIVLSDGDGNIGFTTVKAGGTQYSWALPGASNYQGIGITFPATQSASADANTLDDYEEGTFTPTLVSGSLSYVFQVGKYVKVGRLVSYVISLNATRTSSSSAFQIGGLPFTSDGTGSLYVASCVFPVIGFNRSTATSYIGQVAPGSTTITIYGVITSSTANYLPVLMSDTGSSIEVEIAGTYLAD